MKKTHLYYTTFTDSSYSSPNCNDTLPPHITNNFQSISSLNTINHKTKQLTFNKTKKLKISTYNTRTLLKAGNLSQIIYGCTKYNIDICTIQEHRFQTDNTYELFLMNNKSYMFIYSSAFPNGCGGVGMLISNKLYNHINKVQKISDRILTVTLNTTPRINIISVYAPTNMYEIENKNKFYNELGQYTSELSTHDLTIIAGDFNARLGIENHNLNPKTIGPNMFDQSPNENGNLLASFLRNIIIYPCTTKI